MDAALNQDRPTLLRDRSFWGLNLTQFLGAFNDNLFKQLVFLLCLDHAKKGRPDLQGVGAILFAVPFIFISGYAGFLSDRYSKRKIIVLCKMAEVLIVVVGMIGFLQGSLPFLLGVLGLMGVHSAFFGPSKYGILPEMLRSEDLPRANGMMLMATFLAIIFGISAAGFAKQQFNNSLWMASVPCLLVAVSGLATSLVIRPTPVAQPDLKFDISSIAVAPDTRRLLAKNRTILGALLISSVFWFLGGTVYPLSINTLCKKQFRFDDIQSGILAASTGLGIAIGCIVAGILSKDCVRGWIVRVGAWGITISLLLVALPGPGWNAVRDEIKAQKSAVKQKNKQTDPEAATNADAQAAEDAKVSGEADANGDQLVNPAGDPFYRGTLLGPYGIGAAFIAVGLFAGFFSVPLQVYLQSASPVEQKGRIIGVLNLANWIGIAGAGLVYSIGQLILVDLLNFPYAMLFAFAGILMLPVALFYRPPDTKPPV